MTRIGVAAFAAVAAFAMVAPLTASADGFYGPPPYRYPHHDNGDAVAAGLAGLIGGVIVGSALTQPAPPPPPVYVAPPVYVPAPPPPVYVAPAQVYVAPAPVAVAPARVYTGPVVATPHVNWCRSHYRSYNPYNNTWLDNQRRYRVCVSPYG